LIRRRSVGPQNREVERPNFFEPKKLWNHRFISSQKRFQPSRLFGQKARDQPFHFPERSARPSNEWAHQSGRFDAHKNEQRNNRDPENLFVWRKQFSSRRLYCHDATSKRVPGAIPFFGAWQRKKN